MDKVFFGSPSDVLWLLCLNLQFPNGQRAELVGKVGNH